MCALSRTGPLNFAHVLLYAFVLFLRAETRMVLKHSFSWADETVTLEESGET